MLEIKQGPDGVIRHASIAEECLAGAREDLGSALERLRAGEEVSDEELLGIITGLVDAQRLVTVLAGGEA